MLCQCAILYNRNWIQLFFQNISRVNVQCRASKQRTSWVVHTKLVGVLLLQSWANKKQRMQSRLQSCAEFRLSTWILSRAKGSPELKMAAPCNIHQHHNYPSSQLSSNNRNNETHLFPFKIRFCVISNLQKYHQQLIAFVLRCDIRYGEIRFDICTQPCWCIYLHCIAFPNQLQSPGIKSWYWRLLPYKTGPEWTLAALDR